MLRDFLTGAISTIIQVILGAIALVLFIFGVMSGIALIGILGPLLCIAAIIGIRYAVAHRGVG